MRCIHFDKPSLSRLALALLMPFAAFALQWLLWDYFKPYAWFLFFPAVFFSVWIGGWVGGIAATLLSALLVWHFFMPLIPYLEFEVFPTPFSTVVFVLMGGLLAFFHHRVSRSDRSAARLRLLAGTIEKIAAVRDLPSLMAIVRDTLRELTGADGITLVLRDNDHCHYVDEDAIGPLWKGQRFPLESCISGWTVLHAEAVAIEDIYADPRIPHDAYRPTFVKSLAMVPIGRDQPVGAIGCYWAKQHRATPEELELQQALADAMSVGLANVDLLQSMENARLAAEQAAATAQESEMRFRRLFHEAPVPLCFVNQNGELGDFNKRFEQKFGYSPADVPTLTEWRLRAYPDPDYRAKLLKSWSESMARATATGNDIEPLECRISCKNGKSLTVLVSGIKLGEDLLFTFFDVTERKQAEEALRKQTEELQRRNEELERLSHASTGREIEMIRLKQQVNALALQTGQEPPYPLTFLEATKHPGRDVTL